MRTNKKIIVVHPERQHSFHTASALEKQGLLFAYITTVYNKKGNLTNFISRFLGNHSKRKAESRYCSNISDERIIQFYEWHALLSLIFIRLPYVKKVYASWRFYLNKKFAKKVFQFIITNKIDAVISYDFCSDILFKLLAEKAPNVTRILDVSIANRAFLKENYIKDMMKTGTNEIQKEQYLLWDEKVMSRVLYEINNAHYFFAPSEIVKESLLYSGAKNEQIFVIPYGVDANKFTFMQKADVKRPLELLYVGQVIYRKGLHHLLETVTKYQSGEVRLNIAGAYTKDSSLVQKYNKYENINFLGFITRDILAGLYQKSDVFVFPSLGEGYALVLLEALSCGMPVICSNYSGGNDAIINGYNGFVFEASKDDVLKDRIDWFLKNGDKLPELSLNARQASMQYSWDRYYSSICYAIEKINSIREETNEFVTYLDLEPLDKKVTIPQTY